MRRSIYARMCRKYLTKKVLTDLHQLQLFRYTILKAPQLVYVRIDGIMKGDVFIPMEIEAIELHLWLEADSCSTGMVELCRVFLRSA